ncbi:MAG TPA: helix-turn-helix transcriptional regulator [Candidatus Binatia bacterium]|jgi:transcriptional regulator with XRE-family HTH domain|nr:helix-turn-helix transcriptional regulator [Candidatus Binatia bacterium]
MSDFSGELPLRSLGMQLKKLRLKQKESVADVAGAVEVDEVVVQRIEKGSERPSEDILTLLINHFGIREEVADNLWVLAGYDEPDERLFDMHEAATGHPLMVMMALDLRILYSDQAQLTADKNGVVISFMQEGVNSQGKAQKLPISRIGMSYDQARDFLRVLHQTLSKADGLRQPKGLPMPKAQSGTRAKKPGTN